MQNVRVFLNPQASQGRDQTWETLIQRQLFRSRLEFVHPMSLAHFKAEIDRAVADRVDVIISVGGDGTLHALIQQLAHQATRFLVLPAGTANDLARELGTNQRLQRALECVRRDEWKAIDLITVNGTSMATNGGLGLVGDVASKVNQLRGEIPGFTHLMGSLKHQVYSLMLGLEVFLRQPRQLTLGLRSSEFTGEVQTPLLLINNQPTLAGNFLVAPQTCNHDGRFNVTVFTHRHLCDLVAAICRVRMRIPPANDPQILSFETESLMIEQLDSKASPLRFFGDGELLGQSQRFEIGIKPSSLRVYTQELTKPQLAPGFPQHLVEAMV